MPKEYVFQSTQYGDPDTSRPSAKVGWSKEPGHVELATVMPEGNVLQSTPEGNGWFLQLDRDGINRLIRLLRRARDTAFGADA